MHTRAHTWHTQTRRYFWLDTQLQPGIDAVLTALDLHKIDYLYDKVADTHARAHTHTHTQRYARKHACTRTPSHLHTIICTARSRVLGTTSELGDRE